MLVDAVGRWSVASPPTPAAGSVSDHYASPLSQLSEAPLSWSPELESFLDFSAGEDTDWTACQVVPGHSSYSGNGSSGMLADDKPIGHQHDVSKSLSSINLSSDTSKMFSLGCGSDDKFGLLDMHNPHDDSSSPFDDGLDSPPPTMIKAEPPCSPPVSAAMSSGRYHHHHQSSIFPESAAMGATDAGQLDIYRDLILRHLIQDITTTCQKLALPTDPYQWTSEQSARWIGEMAAQFQLGGTPQPLCLAGRVLCAMNQEEFLDRAPNGGDTLHAQLQLWKTAAESYHQSGSSGNMGSMGGSQQSGSNVSEASSSSFGQCSPPPSMMTSSLGDMTQLSLTDFLSSFNPSMADAMPAMGAASINLQHSISHTGNFYSSAHNGNSHSSMNGVTQNGQSNGHQGHGFFRQHHHHQQQHHQQSLGVHTGLLPSPAHSDPSDSGISADSYAEEEMDACAQIKPRRHTMGGPTGNIHLWQFIRELLDNPAQFSACVRWLDRKEGIFKIENSHQLARLWGQRKNRTKMNYDKLSRSLRQYYKKNIIKKTGQKQRLIYQFIPPYHFA
uniref:ETS domain-containing protein n=1 Tax=Plectus sambesii TaxID=2011161 RepID=A0A914V9R2_9BILA